MLDALNASALRLQFGAGARVEFYESLMVLMENGVLLGDALRDLYKAASAGGRGRRSARAAVLYECMMSVSEGLALSVALAPWVPAEECSLLGAGEKSGRLVDDHEGPGAFTRAIKVAQARSRIAGAAKMATMYPAVLIVLAVVLLNMVAYRLVPKLARVADPSEWEGAARALYLVATAVTTYGKPALVVAVGAGAWVIWSLPRRLGPARFWLDKVPPWSVYRMLYGATFLLSVAAMLQAGVKLQEALALLARNANPWLRQRIEAARYGISLGATLGKSLMDSGYDFPARAALPFLVVLSGRQGFEKAIDKYADRWLEESIRRIQATARVLLALGVLGIGVLMVLVVLGAGGIQEAVQSRAGR